MPRFTLFWLHANGQNSMNMGSFESREEAEADIPAARQELLDQGSDDDAEWINAGTFVVEEDEDDGE